MGRSECGRINRKKIRNAIRQLRRRVGHQKALRNHQMKFRQIRLVAFAPSNY